MVETKLGTTAAWILTLACAELFGVLVRRRELLILFKQIPQRTDRENKQVAAGIGRSLVLEAVLFIPVSATPAHLILQPWILALEPFREMASTSLHGNLSFCGIMGIVSYGFPFASLRQLVVRIAVQTLHELSDTARRGDGEASLKNDAGRAAGA
jgi:hypothetical protein